MDSSDLVVARTSGVIMHEGRRHPIRRGVTIARAGHPLVEKSPKLWQPLRVHYDLPGGGRLTAGPASGVAAVIETFGVGGVEQATAAPGELRDVQPTPAPEEPGGAAEGQEGPAAEPEPEPAPEGESPRRPPTSGPGSGNDAWRRHAADKTRTPLKQWASKNRDDIRRELYGEGGE
ncbi:hypothetical protein AWW66_03345 [Micromonospora rosaria]|uniref:Uncharacterized protein n=1 Tax=Micromonospora rosaria TaxID=47874 RepID=A0A136PY49_9ACTN|nr:hypothetical protein [Micromonospora rosaria]KXK63362.1 hypothetical protein AWW66_03345 [Micromonospora rosaria]